MAEVLIHPNRASGAAPERAPPRHEVGNNMEGRDALWIYLDHVMRDNICTHRYIDTLIHG